MNLYTITLNKNQLNETIRQAKQKGITLKTAYYKEHLIETAFSNYGIKGKNFHLYALDCKTKNILFELFI